MESTLAQPQGKISAFTDLYAWQEGHKLVLMIYRAIKQFPPEEKFDLSKQLRRAVVSITSNIAEGFSRQSYREKVQFYAIALGSLTEVQNQTIIARDIQYIPTKVFDELMNQSIVVSRLTNGLIKKSKTIILNS